MYHALAFLMLKLSLALPEMMAYPMVWTPVMDFQYSKNPFFTQEPVKSVVSGEFNKVPTMIGTLKDEGLLHTAVLR